MRRFCRDCGNEADEFAQICTNCGGRLPSVHPATRSGRARLPSLSKKNKLLVISLLAIFIGVFTAYKWAESYHHPEAVLERFFTAVDNEDVDYLIGALNSADAPLEVKEENVRALLAYWEEEDQAKKDTFEYLEESAEGWTSSSPKWITSMKDERSEAEWQPLVWKNEGKKLLFFDSFVFMVQPVFLVVHTNYPDTTFYLDGEEQDGKQIENRYLEIGPVLPGAYTLTGILETEQGPLEKKMEVSIFQENHVVDLYFDVALMEEAEEAEVEVDEPDSEKETDEPKEIVLQAEELVSDYLYGLVDSINLGDFRWVEPYLLPNSELYGMQKDLVERLYEAETKEAVVEYEILKSEEVADDKGTVFLTVSETIDIQKKGEGVVTKTFVWKYTAQIHDGKYYLSNLEEADVQAEVVSVGNKWAGEWERVSMSSPGFLTIDNVKGNTADLALEVFSGAHVGNIEGTVTFNGNTGVLVIGEDNCQLDLSLADASIMVSASTDCSGYGGMGVTFDGEYLNPSAAASVPEETLSSRGIIDAKSDEEIQRLLGSDYENLVLNMQLVYDKSDAYGLENTLILEGGVRGLYTLMEAIIVMDGNGNYYIGSLMDKGSQGTVLRVYTNDSSYNNKLHEVVEAWRERFSDYPVEWG